MSRSTSQRPSIHLFSRARWWVAVQSIWAGYLRHDAATQSAALAFYSILAIAPLLLTVIAVAGTVFGHDEVRVRMVAELSLLMGPMASASLNEVLRGAHAGAGVAGALGLIAGLVGASAVFIQLQEALNRIWEVEPRPGPVLPSLLRKRFVSLALLLSLGFLLVVSLVAEAGLTALRDYLAPRYPEMVAVLRGAELLFSLGLTVALFAAIFRVLPDAVTPWNEVWFGSIVSATLFSLGRALIAFYLANSMVISAYGAAGSVVLLLLWVYYSSLIVLLGAEITRARWKSSPPRPEQVPGVRPKRAPSAA